MNLIDLALEIGLQPCRTASTYGGEYHSACPDCGGTDRFVIWPNQKQDKCMGRYWCRQCNIHGDAIDFCRNFLGLSWEDSINKLRLPPIQLSQRNYGQLKKAVSTLSIAKEPSQKWKEKASDFVHQCHSAALRNPRAMKEFYERGFTDDTIKEFKLGYCYNSSLSTSKDIYDDFEEWGLDPETKENGTLKRFWLPHGLVIPSFSEKGEVTRINIRRLDWHHEDKFGKYTKVKGGLNAPAVYGDPNKRVVIILESELDAILIQQFAADTCFCVATGGSTQPLDFYTDHLIRRAILPLICPDVDPAGAKFFQRLKEIYKRSKLWPAPLGKSPGDAFKDFHIDLRAWILQGLPDALKPRPVQSYAFTCKNCGRHDYWISVFNNICCMYCIDPKEDETLVQSKHFAEDEQKVI